MRRIPKLEVEISKGEFFSMNIEVYIYSNDYWVLTKNVSMISCGFVDAHSINIYENGRWKEVKNADRINPPDNL